MEACKLLSKTTFTVLAVNQMHPLDLKMQMHLDLEAYTELAKFQPSLLAVQLLEVGNP